MPNEAARLQAYEFFQHNLFCTKMWNIPFLFGDFYQFPHQYLSASHY